MAELQSGFVTVLAVLIGGWLSSRAQFRQSEKQDDSNWRAVRIAKYAQFLTAYRQYIAYALDPEAKISAVPHPRLPNTMMPFFDATGRRYREQLEAARAELLLACVDDAVEHATLMLLRQARSIAASRHNTAATDIPPQQFEALWTLEREVINQARKDLGLSRLRPFSYDREATQGSPGAQS